MLRTFEFKTLRSPNVVHLVSVAVPQVKEPTKNILYPQVTPEALQFFYAANWEKEIARISPSEKFAYPTTQLLKHPANSASTYCWVWVPPSSPSSWATLTAIRDRSLSNPPLHMLSPSLVQPWWHLGILSTSLNQKNVLAEINFGWEILTRSGL